MIDRLTPFDATLVLVDDEPEILEILETRFQGVAQRIHSFTDPKKAVEFAQTHPIDTIIMDLKMPGMDGLMLFSEVKKLQPSIVGIFLTGFGDKGSVQTALKLGAFDFVDKPFNDKLLLSAVRRALEHAQSNKLIREILELFIKTNTQLDPATFDSMPVQEREKALRAALGVAKMKIANLRSRKSGEPS